MFTDYRDLSREWAADADRLMSLSAAGRNEEAVAQILTGPFAELGLRATAALEEWTQQNVALSSAAGNATVTAIEDSRRNILIAVGIIMALSGALGFLTFRRIVLPVRALQTSVESMAAGDYVRPVPFTDGADEIGALARAIDVLKNGASRTEEQSWVKANVARITRPLQGAPSQREFGQRLLTELIPALGGGVADIYLVERDREHLRRIASYGLAEGADAYGLGANG